MVRSTTRRSRARVLTAPAGGGPDLSVLIASKDRADILRGTLERIDAQRGPDLDVQLLVCDSASSDHTSEMLETLKGPLSLHVERETRPGKNRALNRLLPHVGSALVVFTDDDVIPTPEWLRALARAAEEWPDAGIFGGRTTLAAPPGFPDAVFALEEQPGINFARYAPRPDEGETTAPPNGPNLAVRTNVLKDFGLDDSIGPDGSPTYTMGSETDLILRMVRGGTTIVYVPDAHVRHIVRPDQLTRKQLFARSFRVGLTWSRLIQPYPEGPMLGRAPRWHWRALLEGLGAHLVSRARHTPDAIETGLTLHRLRGILHEYRNTHGAGSPGPSS
ncbi:MAG: glycosyltransferase [Gemmatimonadota bacterium]